MILKNSKGETFVETLVSILILAVVITGFSNVIASTAKVNAKVKSKRLVVANESESSSGVSSQSNWIVSIKDDNDSRKTTYTYDVEVYYDSVSELYYYEHEND